MTFRFFADISNNNGADVDTSAITADAVICKASEGAGFTDRYRDDWQPELEARGIPTGNYHFHRGSASSAAQLERWKNSALGAGSLRPVIDAEDNKRTISPAAMARSVLDLAESAAIAVGVEPVIYTGAWWLGQYCTRDPALARWPLWLSAYPLGNARAPSDAEAASWFAAGKYCAPPAPWDEVFAWQFTSIAHIAGVPGNCDRSIITDTNLSAFHRTPPVPPEDDMRPEQAIFFVKAPHPDAGTYVLGAHGFHDAVRMLDPDHLAYWRDEVGLPVIELAAKIWDQIRITEPGHVKA